MVFLLLELGDICILSTWFIISSYLRIIKIPCLVIQYITQSTTASTLSGIPKVALCSAGI